MNHVLFTPPLMIETANAANYAVYCNVLNASSSPRTGTLEIIKLDGTVIGSAAYNTVAPGGGTGIQVQKFQNTAPITLFKEDWITAALEKRARQQPHTRSI